MSEPTISVYDEDFEPERIYITPSPRTPKRLAAKLVEAAKDVEGVGKRGFNQQQRYTYVTAEDIAEAAARALLKHEVFTDFEVLEVKSETIKSNRGGEGRLVTIKGRLIATDAESGESVSRQAYGSGTDYPGDKAIYKAMTGARKYAFIHLLGIPIGDEAEATPRREALTPKPKLDDKRAEAIRRAIKERQLTYKAIDELLGAAGIDALRARSPKALNERIESLTDEQADALEAELGGGSE